MAVELPMAGAREDVWVPTACDMCFNACTVRVHRVDGVAVKVEGIPEAGPNYGSICAKGQAALMNVYSPHRVQAPMVRTNPRKGLEEDPGWREVSWDQALDLLISKLQAARDKDPRSLLSLSFDRFTLYFMRAFATAFGSPNVTAGSATFFCGNGTHPVAYSLTGSNEFHPDLHHCDHLVMFGASLGFVAGHNAMGLTRAMAEARARGMKLTVVDPVLSYAASQADEWIPIRPATDAALALALMREWVTAGTFDRDFLLRHTNAAYLIGSDGRYVRDAATGKPLVGVAAGGVAAFDAVKPEDACLDGSFAVNGQAVRPSFEAFRDNLGSWTPEHAEEVTTVPAATIRRLARELAGAAQIGQTIELEGDVYPLRPASVTWYRGISAHRHAMLTGMAMGQLNVLLGAVDVPGGILNSASAGPGWQPTTDPDGLLIPNNPYMGAMLGSLPRRKVRQPETLQLIELFPLSVYGHSWMGLLRGEELGLDYGAEVLIQSRGNIVATAGDPEAMAEALRRIPFICSINPFVDETSQFADLLLPDTHSLERLVPLVANPFAFYTSAAQPNERYTWNFQQPVVKAVPAARHWGEVMLEVAERLGIAPDLYTAFNGVVHLSDPYRLRRDRHYTWDEIADVWARSVCGEEHGLAYFKEHGYYTGEARTARTSYPLPFHGARIPLYLEHFLDAGEMVRDYTQSRGVVWDTADYRALVDWKPCLTEAQAPPEFDLWVVNQKLPFMTFSFSAENPMLVDLAKRSTKVYNVGINRATADRRGISDGDRITLETPDGRRAEGTARLSEGIHPDCLAVPGVLGRWAVGNPGARRQGIHVNGLLTYTLDHMDTLSAALDSCVKVRVRRVD